MPRFGRYLHAILFLSASLTSHYAQSEGIGNIGGPNALNTNAEVDSLGDTAPQIATDGDGNWIAVWESEDDLGGTLGLTEKILTARSLDNGAHWTDPLPVNQDAALDELADKGPRIAMDGQGNAVAAWWTIEDNLGNVHVYVSKSAVGDSLWSEPTQVSLTPASATTVDVATDGESTWIVAWSAVAADSDDLDIFMVRSTDNGGSWSAPTFLNNNAGTDSSEASEGDPDSWSYVHDQRLALAADSAGHWVAAWQTETVSGIQPQNDFEIVAARSGDNGSTWSDPAPLDPEALSNHRLDSPVALATDLAGGWLTAWDALSDSESNGRNKDMFVSRSDDRGAAWSAPVVINENSPLAGDDDRHATVAGDGAGHWLAVWASSNLILIARSDDDGSTWSEPQPINYHLDDENMLPHVGTDRDGRWLIAWDSTEDSFGNEAFGHDNDVLINAIVLPPDCNLNGIDDAIDIVDGTSANCNNNPYPDECEFDCDGDGIPDDCEPDCDFDEIPDDCEADCDADDIPDDCEWDCDEDGIPDDCDAEPGYERGLEFGAAISTQPITFQSRNFHLEIAIGQSGHMVAVVENIGVVRNSEPDLIAYGSSSDYGATWSNFAAFSPDADPLLQQLRPSVFTDGNGVWVAGWIEALTEFIHTPNDRRWHYRLVRSVDNGFTWENRTTFDVRRKVAEIGGPIFEHKLIRAAADGRGNWLAVFISDDDVGEVYGNDWDIFVTHSADHAQNWSTPMPVNTNAATDFVDDWDPVIATDRDGNWVVAWSSYNDLDGAIGEDSDILFATSSDNGASWSDPAPLNTNAEFDSEEDGSVTHETINLAADSQGHWVATWGSKGSLGGTLASGRKILVARSEDNGTTWTDPAPLATTATCNPGNEGRHSLATDDSGNWVAVWASGGGAFLFVPGHLFVSRSFDQGKTWTEPNEINPDILDPWGTIWHPSVVSDRNGNWALSRVQDGRVEYQDYGMFITHFSLPADCNDNGVHDSTDIADGASLDCDGNGWPDECDLDCGNAEEFIGFGQAPAGDCDGDGVDAEEDNCLTVANGDQSDTDEDGVGDACDCCLDDPEKTRIGSCGCGIADTDTDGDGEPDCHDLCPIDELDDRDGDGACDSDDECPTDPDKIERGQCGCLQPETEDSDGDGVADCVDECPESPGKIEPGLCGCDVEESDLDTDSDGTLDCIDECPENFYKIEPGACGCDALDSDEDGDGAMDCLDGCPDDPDKTSPGESGCGKTDAGSDADRSESESISLPNPPTVQDSSSAEDDEVDPVDAFNPVGGLCALLGLGTLSLMLLSLVRFSKRQRPRR